MDKMKRFEPWAIGFAIVLPTIVTWIYFVSLADDPSRWQQMAAVLGKSIQFLFPLVWVLWVCRERLGSLRWSSRGVSSCVAFGVLVVVTMLTLYHFVFKPLGWFVVAAEHAVEKVEEIGIGSKFIYVGVGAFYALVHSGLEEYYWRWFVFGRLTRWVSVSNAAIISSLGFMSHHVILLAVYFGWDSPLAYFFSFCVAIGGFVWAIFYHKTKNLWGPWLSHLVVDAGIFVLGYDVVGHLI